MVNFPGCFWRWQGLHLLFTSVCFWKVSEVSTLFEFAAVSEWDGPKWGQNFDLRTGVCEWNSWGYSYIDWRLTAGTWKMMVWFRWFSFSRGVFSGSRGVNLLGCNLPTWQKNRFVVEGLPFPSRTSKEWNPWLSGIEKNKRLKIVWEIWEMKVLPRFFFGSDFLAYAWSYCWWLWPMLPGKLGCALQPCCW